MTVVAITPDDRYVISASRDKTLKSWDLKTGRVVRTFSGHSAQITALATTADGRAISVAVDGTLKVWDLRTGQELAGLALEGALRCVTVTPDGAKILAGNVAGNIYCLHNIV